MNGSKEITPKEITMTPNDDARIITAPTEKPPPAREQRPRPLYQPRRRGWLILLLLLAALALVVYWRWPKKPAAEEEAAVVVSVRVAKVEREPIAAEVSAIGTVFPRERATVSAKLNAQIKRMPLLRNKSVKAGEVIAVLEARDLQAQRAEAAAALQEAEHNARNVNVGTIPQTTAQDEKALRDARANVANARAVYERRQTLYDRGGISKKDLDASQLTLTTAENDLRLAESTARLHAATIPNDRAAAAARVKQAQERLAALDTQLSYASIRAPFSGTITEQFQFEGEFAAAGAKLFTLADTSTVIVKAPFGDTVAAQLRVGNPATIRPQELPGEEFSGRISLVNRASDPQNRTVQVWVDLENRGGRLRADSAAKVVVATQRVSDAVVVPAAAVTLDATNADQGKVMVVDDKSIAHETKVMVGIRTPDRIQITSGLSGGETVVIEGNYALPDGAKVEINKGDEKESEPGAETKGESGGEAPAKNNVAPGASPGTSQAPGAQPNPGSNPGPGSNATPSANPQGTSPRPNPTTGAGSNSGSGTGSKPGGKP